MKFTDKKKAEIGQALLVAMKDLPIDYELNIKIQNSGLTLSLADDVGFDVDCENEERGIAKRINEVVRLAKSRQLAFS